MGTKKQYDLPVSRGNTPDLDLYTWLLGLFYGFTGVNALLVYFAGRHDSPEMAASCLLLGISSLLLTPLAVIDRRQEMRGLFAVVGSGIMHLFLAGFCAFFWPWVLLAWGAEWMVCGFCIYWFKGRTKRSARRRRRN